MDLFKILGGEEIRDSEELRDPELHGRAANAAGHTQRERKEQSCSPIPCKRLIRARFSAYKIYKPIHHLFCSRYSLRLLVFSLCFLILIPTILVFFRPSQASAAWFDDSYAYRQKITFTHNASLTNASMRLTISNTNTLVSAGKMQTSCNDSRFTDANGKVLRFNLVSGCNSASTIYDVVFPTVINGNNLAYFYYGNPSALSASDPSVPTGTTPSGSTSFASEEKGPGPVAYWRFDEGYGTSAHDSTSNNNVGTISGATWQTEDMCVSGKCLYFNGTSGSVSVSNTISGVQTVSFWVRPATSSASLVQLAANTDIKATSGTVSTDGFTSPTIYVNGVINGTFSANNWNFVTVTTGTGITASSITLGKMQLGILNGFLDEVRFYDYARSVSQIKSDFIARGARKGSAAVLGVSQGQNLSNGLIGYWKFDESSGNASDSAGSNTTLYNNNSTSFATGKFGNAASFTSSSSNYFSLSYSPSDISTSGATDLSVSANCTAVGGTLNGGKCDWTPSNGSSISGRYYNVGTFTIANSTTVNITAYNGTTGGKLEIHANTINIAGTLNGNAAGYTGGNAGSGGSSSNPGNPGVSGIGLSGTTSDGGSYGSAGGPGVSGGNGWSSNGCDTYTGGMGGASNHTTYGTYSGTDIDMGGGAAGGGGGGAMGGSICFPYTGSTGTQGNKGGGAVYLYSAGNITVSGAISMSGGAGGAGGAGGDRGTGADYGGNGSGGSGAAGGGILLNGNSVTVSGTLNANGGAGGSPGTAPGSGGSSGNLGGSGRIKLFSNSVTVSGSVSATGYNTSSYTSCNVGTIYCALANINSVQTVSFWTNPTSTTDNFLNLTSSAYITASSGTVNATGFTNPSVYVNGVLNGTITANTWNHVVITTNTPINANLFEVGLANSGYMNGKIDDVRLYNRALSPSEIRSLYAWAPGPVGWWKFDEGSGTSANDTSGNGNTGTLTNSPLWTTGKIGKALQFNGSNSYVSLASGLSSVQTVSFWLKTGNTTQKILDLNGSAYIQISSGAITATGWTSPTIYVDGKVSSTVDTSWHHIAITTASPINASAINFGKVGSNYFSGTLDDIRIYSYARSPAQIAWDYNRGKPVDWWKFDECYGTTAHDASSNGNNGTITIGPLGSQTSVGTCNSGSSSEAWNNGTNGKFNASINLDGTDDYITTSAFSPLASAGTTTTNLSWGSWFYPTTSVASKTLMEKATEFRIRTDTSSNAICGIYYSSTFNDASSVTAPLTLNSWNHVLCTYDGANLKTYINGVLENTTANTNSITAASSILYVGENSSSAQQYSGQIDDIRIYNYTLTTTQVKNLYNGDAAVRFAPLTGSP